MSAVTRVDLGDQTGRTFVITGATSGLGREAALALAQAGARVVLAARSPERLNQTRATIAHRAPAARLEELVVDLSDLSSVRHAAGRAARLGAIDVLLNNAGVMGTPYARTVDGLELQMATNHFGPFLLTGLLLPQLVASGAGRVVNVASGMHHTARSAPLHDPRATPGRYLRWQVYAQSKLANLLMALELDRRCRDAGLPVQGFAAHPGYAATHLLAHGQTLGSSGRRHAIWHAVQQATAQSAVAGAQPLLLAATGDLPGGSYCGPDGFRELRGNATVVRPSRLARDRENQQALWEISQRTVGLEWP